VSQPIVQQQLIQQPIVETRQIIQPVIRRIVTQPSQKQKTSTTQSKASNRTHSGGHSAEDRCRADCFASVPLPLFALISSFVLSHPS
jgi:hypothetical protein